VLVLRIDKVVGEERGNLTMKSSKLSKVIGATALGLSLAILPAHLSASAQTSGGTTSGSSGATGTTTGAPAASDTSLNGGRRDNGNGSYWGLLGLLGLIGLAGRGRDNSATTYRDPNEVGTGAKILIKRRQLCRGQLCRRENASRILNPT